jgi:hypothetical protein
MAREYATHDGQRVLFLANCTRCCALYTIHYTNSLLHQVIYTVHHTLY